MYSTKNDTQYFVINCITKKSYFATLVTNTTL